MRWRPSKPIESVFVLGTGRCGTVTFIEACQHLTNFSASHESLSHEIGPERFAYPQRHIEADNRLSWFLGALGARFADETTLYIHLRRDRQLVASSFAQRWHSPYKASVIRAFAHGLVTRTAEWPPEAIHSVCEFYVDTVTTNVDEFIASRRSMTIYLEEAAEQFPTFVDRVNGSGNLEAMLAEFDIRHNATVTAPTPDGT